LDLYIKRTTLPRGAKTGRKGRVVVVAFLRGDTKEYLSLPGGPAPFIILHGKSTGMGHRKTFCWGII